MGNNDVFNGQNFIVHALISILVGVLLIAYPNVALNFMVYIIGGLAILIGGITLISLKNQTKELTSGRRFLIILNGAIGILLGGVLIAFPTIYWNILVILIGIVILVVSIMQFYMLWQRKMVVPNTSAKLFMLPAVIFITGSLIVYNPFVAAISIVRVIGIAILLYGIFELILRWQFRKSSKSAQNYID